MTEARTPLLEECRHCGKEFTPRKLGHVFCSIFCRHRGERQPHERKPVDVASIERLFAPDRELEERVRPDDWHPNPGTPWVELDAYDTVERRRRWYMALLGN